MRKFAWLVQSLLLLIIFILLLFSPEAAFSGAMRGLKLWAMTLLPSLLPFLILSELLLSSNIVYQLGRLLEPVMRPLFICRVSAPLLWRWALPPAFPWVPRPRHPWLAKIYARKKKQPA